MKNEKLLHAIGEIDDKYIIDAAPGRHASDNQPKTFSPKRRIMRYVAIAACMAVFIIATTAFAANYIQDTLDEFYLRYLSAEEMAVADSIAEHLGAKIYFSALKSGDLYKTYFAINKLVEYYNDENVRQKAIQAITPFLANENEKISDAAAFALSVLTQTFDDPRIVHLADGTLVFALFNDYSDYGTYNKLWIIKDGELSVFIKFVEPQMYIRYMLPSPDAKLLAVYTISNKSGFVVIHDLIGGYVSAELIDSARYLVAKDMGYSLRQRIDFENYSELAAIDGQRVADWDGGRCIRWVDNDTLEFGASLSGDIMGSGEYGDFYFTVAIRYDYRQMSMEYSIITD